jgi:hypothetical protein
MQQDIKFHYTIQACDTNNYQVNDRFCNTDRTTLSKKSIVSALNTIKHLADNKLFTNHYINIVEDNCSPTLNNFLSKISEKYLQSNIKIEITHLEKNTGIDNSIKYCYEWLENNGTNFVFLIQDDYIFSVDSLEQCADIFFTILNNLKTDSIVQPFNDINFWDVYKNKVTPRIIITGEKGYWIQIYDTSCSFFTSHREFIKHKDLYKKFIFLVNKKDERLESDSLNHIFTKRDVLGVCPINTLSHHIQAFPDPYVDWKPLWNSINIDS